MPAEHHPGELRFCLDEVAQSQPEIEPRPLPVEPAEATLEGVCDALLSVGGGSEGVQRVRMEMVDVSRRQEAVQGRVDRRDGPARSEAGEIEQADHVVL